MQYKVLVDLLDTLIESQSRVASAQRKNRPESSSPEKLKMRNPQMTNSDKKKKTAAVNDDSDDEDNYSDEEIANDPDEGDDGTNKLMQIKKASELDMEDEDQDDQKYLEEYEKIQRKAGHVNDDDEEDYANDEDQFEDSPRQKVGSQGGLSDPRPGESDNEGQAPDDTNMGDEEDDVDEDEVIDVAEQIFVRIAEAILKHDLRSIRAVFQEAIFDAEIEGQVIELLSPMGLLEGIKVLGIDDLTEKEVTYLMRVLTKPELDGAIVMPEFLQIMENLGLYEEDGQRDESESNASPEQQN